VVQAIAQPLFCPQQVVTRLQVEPEGRVHAEETSQAQRSISGDGTLALNDLADAPLRHADVLGQTILRDAHWEQELFEQDLARMYRIEFSCRHGRSPQW